MLCPQSTPRVRKGVGLTGPLTLCLRLMIGSCECPELVVRVAEQSLRLGLSLGQEILNVPYEQPKHGCFSEGDIASGMEVQWEDKNLIAQHKASFLKTLSRQHACSPDNYTHHTPQLLVRSPPSPFTPSQLSPPSSGTAPLPRASTHFYTPSCYPGSATGC